MLRGRAARNWKPQVREKCTGAKIAAAEPQGLGLESLPLMPL
jgi:hypothetical protein